MDTVSHKLQHRQMGIPLMDVSGSIIYPKDNFPSYPNSIISPHLVGFWPLNDGNSIAHRDVSGKGNHWLKLTQVISSGATGWKQGGGADMRIGASPLDARYDISAPGNSFVMGTEIRVSSVAGGADQTLIAKGLNGSGGAIGLIIGMIDNGAGIPRMRIVLNNTNYYSSNFPAWSSSDNGGLGTFYKLHVVRDANAAMGTNNRLYVYINGVRDTGFNGGAGYVAYAPTDSYSAGNLSLWGFGNNVTGADYAVSGGSGYWARNLQLALLQPNVSLPGVGTPAAMDALITTLAATPSHMMTAGDLP